MTAQATHEQAQPQPHYGIALVLLVLFTGLEIGVAYLSGLPTAVKVAILIFLAALQVGLAVLWFMHLKHDHAFFRLPFALGLVLVVPLVLIVALTIPSNNNSSSSGQAAGNTSSSGQQQTITATETSYKIALSTDSVPAGSITFHVVNDANNLPHQFTIAKTDLAPGNLPLSNGTVDESKLDVVGKTNSLSTGSSTDLTVDLSAGKYVLFCNLPGHYQQGMYTGFTVTGGSNTSSSAAQASPTPAANATEQPTQTSTASAQPTETATEAAQPTATPAAATRSQTITATETTYKIALSTDSVPAGSITFHVVNDANNLPHQFTIAKTDLAPSDLPVSDGSVDESKLDIVGKTDTLSTGDSTDLTVDLSAGKYVLFCNLPGHYQQGMYTGFTVTSASNTSSSAAQASPTPAPNATEQPTTIPAATTQSNNSVSATIELWSYWIAPSPDSVQAGPVNFHVENPGSMYAHQLTVIQTDMKSYKLPTNQDGEVDLSQLQVVGTTDQIAPGGNADLNLSLAAGHYVLISNLPNDYYHGMYADFTVKGATDQPTATPQPAATSTEAAQPTETIQPTATSTKAARPTNTTQPTATLTQTVQLTAMPQPTATATETPKSTNTPQPTTTPTQVAQPTNTTQPTATPTQAAQPTATTAQSQAATITAKETSYKIAMSTDSVAAGTITFHVENNAEGLPHQFTIAKTDLAPGNLPVSNGSVDESKLDIIGKTDIIAAGGSADLTVDLSAGKYVLFCNLPGHYQQGMYTGFTVN